MSSRPFLLFFIYLIASKAPADSLQNGAYMVRISGCADCHTTDLHKPMAGGFRLPSPFGTFYTPNITPDKDTGIGNWSEADFANALRFGKRPDGKLLFPAFPYRAYSKLTDSDIHDMFMYLRTLEPVHAENIPHDLKFPFNQRWLMYFWQELFFGTWSRQAEQQIRRQVGPIVPDPAKSSAWNRGAYLVEAAAHCTECHTPRNSLGGLKNSLWMSGTADGPNGSFVPNITPDPTYGIIWTTAEWIEFLVSGNPPNKKPPGAEMADVILNTSFLTTTDQAAIVEYVRSLKPIHRYP